MLGQDGKERRRAFRVDDDVHLEFRVISDQDAHRTSPDQAMHTCRALMQLRELSTQSSHILSSIRKQHAEIAQYLSLLDRKIEAVAQLAGAISLGSEIQPNTRVNLSASGLAFSHHSPIAVGSQLHTRLILFPSLLCIQPMGKVVYCRENTPADTGQHYRIGVEFDELPEQQQDMLIRHLLERQSAQRRRERGLED